MMNSMTYRGYTASMSFDPEDKIIVGRVLEVEDIISFHAESVADFEAAFHDIIDDYIVACESLEQEPERPASGKMMLRVSPEVHATALKAAARSGVSLNKWAEQALRLAGRKRTKEAPIGPGKARQRTRAATGRALPRSPARGKRR